MKKFTVMCAFPTPVKVYNDTVLAHCYIEYDVMSYEL